MGDMQAQSIWLERQADHLERVFLRRSLPMRVVGGSLREGRVRYHLAPVASAQLEGLEGLADELALALGTSKLRLLREEGGIALEIEDPVRSDLRLLPLMVALGDLPPWTAVMGMSDQGRPLTYSLALAEFNQLLVVGAAGSGKSELLRTLLVSLALTSRPSQLQIMAIDLSGRELTFLESLPHSLTDIASASPFALELIEWLDIEVLRRRRSRLEQPWLCLAVEDVEVLPGRLRRRLQALLERLASEPVTGIHVMLSSTDADIIPCQGFTSHPSQCCVKLEASAGEDEILLDGEEVKLNPAWLPARDLAAAAELIRRRPGDLAADRLRLALAGEAR